LALLARRSERWLQGCGDIEETQTGLLVTIPKAIDEQERNDDYDREIVHGGLPA
jgi:hypothetical protein